MRSTYTRPVGRMVVTRGRFLVEAFRDASGDLELATVGKELETKEEAIRLAKTLAATFAGVAVWSVTEDFGGKTRTLAFTAGRVPS